MSRIEERLINENGCVAICDNTAISNEEWLKHRKNYINGTEAGQIAGVSHWGNALSVYLDKVMPYIPKGEPDKWFKFEVGHIMEPLLAKWYEKATEALNYRVENVTYMLRHPTIPFIAGDMDYIAETPEGEIIGLEFKTTDSLNVSNGDFNPGVLGVDGVLPATYEYQVRHYMAVTGINRFIVLVCYGFDKDKVIPVQIYRDLAKEAEIINMEVRFWKEHVLKKVPPEDMVTMKNDLKLIQKSLFDPALAEFELPEDIMPVIEKYNMLKAKKKEADDISRMYEGEINTVLAEACRISKGAPAATKDIDGEKYYEVSNKLCARYSVNRELLETEYPDVYRACLKASEYEQTAIKVRAYKKKC